MLRRVHALSQEGGGDQWTTVKRLEVNHNSPVGPKTKKVISTRSEINKVGPITKVTNGLSPPSSPTNRDGSEPSSGEKWGTRIGQKIGDKIGTLVYRTDYKTIQEYQEFNASLKEWDENLSTGEVRGYGQSRTTVEEPIGEPYEEKIGTYLQDSYWFFERNK